jgi:hypothetical protein
MFVEQALPFPSKYIYKHQTSENLVENSQLKPWTSTRPFLPSIDSMVTRIKLITIPAHQLQNILKICHCLKITLTGLLHSLIVMYLSRSVPEAQGFRATTPYSMRRFTELSEDEIANHISWISTSWPEALLISARKVGENSLEEEELIMRIAKRYQAQMAAELSRVPEFGAPALIEISRIKDLDRFCEDGMKGRRAYTYELSNIGAVNMPEGDKLGVRISMSPLLS